MKKTRSLVIGSRGSALALWQSQWVERQLQKLHPDLKTQIQIVKTMGDIVLDSPLSRIGDKGLFIKELEHSLLDNTIDIAVHSLKDVPTVLTPGLMIAAVCEREDVRDAFVSHPGKRVTGLLEVGTGATIATGSLRRKSQLLHLRSDLRVADIRGNLDTRIEKLGKSDWDGMLLAVAGLTRLGRQDLILEVLAPSLMLPAVGQGALAIESRIDDSATVSLVQGLDHAPTRIATAGERSLLRRLEGGCQIPIGAYARIEENVFRMDAIIGSLDGTRVVRSSITGNPEESAQLGESLADRLLSAGGKELLDEIIRSSR